MLSFAAYPIEIPGEVVFLHPVHNFALVAYDPSALGAGASVVWAAKLLPGPRYTVEEALDIVSSTFDRNVELSQEWREMVDNNRTPLPVKPLHVLPKVTRACASGYECYHREYWTGITSETASSHPYFRPCSMMQVFSLRLSSLVDHSVNVYGSFSIRDCWEPLPNYLFKRSRDDPAMIPQGCSFLPLRSPSRGIYMLQYFLIDVDLWIKEEGDGSSDQQLFCGYVELDVQKAGFGLKLKDRFQGDCYGLNMHYAYLQDSIETVIEVLAEAERSSDVIFSALTSGIDDEIELYDGAFSGRGTILRHVVAVKKQDELNVVLKTNDSLYKWTFQAGVGVVAAPEHPVSGFARYFVMNVSFRTRAKQHQPGSGVVSATTFV